MSHPETNPTSSREGSMERKSANISGETAVGVSAGPASTGDELISVATFMMERERYLQKVHPFLIVRCFGHAYMFQLQNKFAMFNIRLMQDFQYEAADVESLFVTNYNDRWPKEITNFMDFGGLSISPLKMEQRDKIHDAYIMENIPNQWTSADLDSFIRTEFSAKEVHILDLHDFDRCCLFFSEDVEKVQSFMKRDRGKETDITVGNCYSFQKIEKDRAEMSFRVHARSVGLFRVSFTESSLLKSAMEKSLMLPVSSIPEIHQKQLKIPFFEEKVEKEELLQIFRKYGGSTSNPFLCEIHFDSDNKFKAYLSFRDQQRRMLMLYRIYVDGGVEIGNSKRRVLVVPSNFTDTERRLISSIDKERRLTKSEFGSLEYTGQLYESPATLFNLSQRSAGPPYQTPRPSCRPPEPQYRAVRPCHPSESHQGLRPSSNPPKPQCAGPCHPSGSRQVIRHSSNPSRTSHVAPLPPQEFPGASQRLPPDRTRPTGTAGSTRQLDKK